MRKIFIILFTVISVHLPADSAEKKSARAEYKVIQVINGGKLSGKALYTGPVIPKDEMVKLTSERTLCGDALPAGKYIINEKREIRNTIVYIADIQSGKAIPRDPVTIDNVLCVFVPHTNVAFFGNTVINRNSDPVLHGVHPYIGRKSVYNLAIPGKDQEIKRILKRTGLMEFRCSPHPWMRAYIYVFNHPYAAVTGDSGDFSITDIPAGSYEIRAWHEAFGEISLGKVDIVAGKLKKLDVRFQ